MARQKRWTKREVARRAPPPDRAGETLLEISRLLRSTAERLRDAERAAEAASRAVGRGLKKSERRMGKEDLGAPILVRNTRDYLASVKDRCGGLRKEMERTSSKASKLARKRNEAVRRENMGWLYRKMRELGR